MGNVARRRLLGWMAAGAVAPWLAGCAKGLSPRGALSSEGGLSLFYFADTLDAREPGWPVVPRVRLGPARRIGSPPWITGVDAVAASDGDAQLAPLLNAGLVAPERYGGYAALAARLQALRTLRGAGNSLTLENGQCWNGSGLTYLTQGRAGVQGSLLLGSEARVSSDERVLWPQGCASVYGQFGKPVLGATLDAQRREALGVQPFTRISRQGVEIAIVGVTDPYAADESASLADWFARLQPVLREARQQAELVVVMADVGTGPGLWLAERLDEADLLLCARGQDFWPTLIPVARRDGRPLPVCLPGTRGVGFFDIRCRQQGDGWQFTARFLPALASAVEDVPAMRRIAAELRLARAAHARWLDQPLARAPVDLWRRDLLGGTWDALIAAAVGEGFTGPTLLPGLRYDIPLRRGEWITREHLLALNGGYDASILDLRSSADGLRQILEEAADQRFGEPLILDNSQDMPRLQNAQWACRYGAPPGQRISGPTLAGEAQAFACRSVDPRGAAEGGEPLWQCVERYLRGQPAQWALAPLMPPSMSYVEGHPGWHPLDSGQAGTTRAPA